MSPSEIAIESVPTPESEDLESYAIRKRDIHSVVVCSPASLPQVQEVTAAHDYELAGKSIVQRLYELKARRERGELPLLDIERSQDEEVEEQPEADTQQHCVHPLPVDAVASKIIPMRRPLMLSADLPKAKPESQYSVRYSGMKIHSRDEEYNDRGIKT